MKLFINNSQIKNGKEEEEENIDCPPFVGFRVLFWIILLQIIELCPLIVSCNNYLIKDALI